MKNPSSSIAFFSYLNVIDQVTKKPVLPVYWNDNFVTLLPGLERTYTASYFLSDSDGSKLLLEIQAWNVNKETL